MRQRTILREGKTMQEFLRTILDYKKEEVGRLRRNRGAFGETEKPHRPFVKSLRKAAPVALIAEVKKASPSKGVIRQNFDPVAIAKSYEKGGADAVSVLTDEPFFQGSPEHLRRVGKSVDLPVLRKDFIIDTVQVEQAYAIGADAILLIAAALDDVQMRDLYQAAAELGLEPLIEIHNHRELERAMHLEPLMIGINNRDLFTFATDINVTLGLVRYIPKEILVVSESGIDTGEQARKLKDSGVGALLVGEALMRLYDPSALIKKLKGIEN